MSDVSLLIHGKLPPDQFVVKFAADARKATEFFQALPFAKVVEGWLIDALYRRLAPILGDNVAAMICHEIKVVLGIADPVEPPTAA